MTEAIEIIKRLNDLAERGEYEASLALAEEGIASDEGNGSFWIGAGNALYALRRFDEAEKAYKKAVDVFPLDAVGPSNLAGLYYEQKRFKEGLAACHIAIGRDPSYVNAFIHKGNCLTELDEPAAAVEAYEQAETISPGDPLIIFNKAQPLTALGRNEEALSCYETLLEKDPENFDYLSGCAAVQEKCGRFAEAVETYLKLLKQNNSSFLHICLAGCLYNMQTAGEEDQALLLMDRWLAAFPDNPIAVHAKDTLTRPFETKRASADYVSELFDAFADSFDAVLKGLEYRAPSLIAEAVKTVVRPQKPLNVLDLGCGTGLCGKYLKESIEIASLTGIDLSEKMIEKAQERNLYTTLERADILSYLPAHKNSYDLIVSADVFTYLGDLSSVFEGIASALTVGGAAVFTVSENDKNPETYMMEPSGRFVHGRSYVSSELDHQGLVFKTIQDVELRQEMGLPVKGLLIVCMKV